MARLILILMFVAALALVAASLLAAVRSARGLVSGSRPEREMPMPATLQLIAYVLLILLLLGVSTGLIGGL